MSDDQVCRTQVETITVASVDDNSVNAADLSIVNPQQVKEHAEAAEDAPSAHPSSQLLSWKGCSLFCIPVEASPARISSLMTEDTCRTASHEKPFLQGS